MPATLVTPSGLRCYFLVSRARGPGVHDPWAHAQAVEPARGPGDLAAAEDVVPPVRDENDADGETEQEQTKA